jgi:hypothetical protein
MTLAVLMRPFAVEWGEQAGAFYAESTVPPLQPLTFLPPLDWGEPMQ